MENSTKNYRIQQYHEKVQPLFGGKVPNMYFQKQKQTTKQEK